MRSVLAAVCELVGKERQGGNNENEREDQVSAGGFDGVGFG